MNGCCRGGVLVVQGDGRTGGGWRAERSSNPCRPGSRDRQSAVVIRSSIRQPARRGRQQENPFAIAPAVLPRSVGSSGAQRESEAHQGLLKSRVEEENLRGHAR